MILMRIVAVVIRMILIHMVSVYFAQILLLVTSRPSNKCSYLFISLLIVVSSHLKDNLIHI